MLQFLSYGDLAPIIHFRRPPKNRDTRITKKEKSRISSTLFFYPSWRSAKKENQPPPKNQKQREKPGILGGCQLWLDP